MLICAYTSKRYIPTIVHSAKIIPGIYIRSIFILGLIVLFYKYIQYSEYIEPSSLFYRYLL